MPLRCTVSDPRVCRPCFYPRQGLPRGTPEALPPCGGLAVNPWPEGRHSPPEGGSWGLKQFESLRRPQRGVASVSTPNTDAENTLAYGTGDKPRRIKDAACFLSRCRPIEPLQANMRRPCFFPFPGRRQKPPLGGRIFRCASAALRAQDASCTLTHKPILSDHCPRSAQSR